MFQNIKTLFKHKLDGTTEVQLNADFIGKYLFTDVVGLRDVLVEKIADEYLKENKDVITKDIIQNKEFADAVYNAIVLKKTKELL